MITLADIKKPLPFKISVGTYRSSIKEYVENVYGDVLDFDVFLPSIGKNLQRPLVWSLKQKQELVLSVFKDTYIPPICIIQHKSKPGVESYNIEVIDGKQRLHTMLGFYKNEFPINVKGADYHFKDLPEDLQKLYARYVPIHNVAYSYNYLEASKISDDAKVAWFEMINFAGTPQEIEHMNSLKA